MWDRTILKSNAKVALRGRYWTAFLVTLLANAVAVAFSALFYRASWGYRNDFWYGEAAAPNPFVSWGGILYSVFIVLPVMVGMTRFFVHNHFEPAGVGTLFSGFGWGYGNTVGAMFVTDLFVSLWSLLFIIPGIVKAVEYSMVPFLLSDNPLLPGSRARELSRRMTYGEKGAIFVFWLSFFGWFLLGAVCAGVGILFVLPYFEASQAELYLFLRERALERGLVSPAELGLVPPGPQL